MTIETDENTFWICINAIIAASIVIIVCYCVHCWHDTWRAAMAAGYVEKQNTGNSNTIWTKP